jgi:REP element-mobilizing transposase RayT
MADLRQHRGWHNRGKLPHFDESDTVQSISFRLADSVPAYVIDSWKEELDWEKDLPATHPAEIALRERILKYEDLGRGNCWLRQAPVAELVQNALLNFHDERYELFAWCIMPNHVHVLIQEWEGYLLEDVMHSWKSFTASAANKLLKRRGTFWMADYFDRYIRDSRHFQHTVTYIEGNPAEARLVDDAEDWPWSSANPRWAEREF